MRRWIRRLSIFVFSTGLAACGGHDGGTTDGETHAASHGGGTDDSTTSATAAPTTGAATEPPAAPTELAASILEGGVHLTWKDASDDEDNFVLERRAASEAEFSPVIELPFDTSTYHDLAVTAGTEYVYRVQAVNAAGESSSNEVTILVP
ncbi:fibronectin type III domain-containing protein [Nannocystis punicea]|uniref:Fibronectin type III domain-containing protein n=1 Tax=Nannocystis punicea TaxID=2995304 RepID=A0ABY7HBQ6_9BACT|nr:fibronectin type III domain-containing protein [Nannocystis poenicansa]WAS96705.1 fibronectin type III domain-containing protein [Nannocystis poenicansa]